MDKEAFFECETDAGSHQWYHGLDELRILIDPLVIEIKKLSEYFPVCSRFKIVSEHLRRSTRNVKIKYFFPSYLQFPNSTKTASVLHFEGCEDIKGKPNFTNDKKIKEDLLELIIQDAETNNDEEFSSLIQKVIQKNDHKSLESPFDRSLDYSTYLTRFNGLELLDLFNEYKCNYLVTDNPFFMKRKRELKEKCNILLCSTEEILSIITKFLVGHDIFLRADSLEGAPLEGATIESYNWFDGDFVRYCSLWDKLAKNASDPQMNEYLRSLLHERYVFLRYAKDKILFNLQLFDLLKRGNLDEETFSLRKKHHLLIASYHVNEFYHMLWGILDNFAWTLNHKYSLGFSETDGNRMRCTLLNKDFKKKLEEKEGELLKQLDEYKDWMEGLKPKRDSIAHRIPLTIRSIVGEEGETYTEKAIAWLAKEAFLTEEVDVAIERDYKKFKELLNTICEFYKAPKRSPFCV